MNEKKINVIVDRFCVEKVNRTGSVSYPVTGFEYNLDVNRP
jgi:hypothetical protein